jgi:hypothetical protein
MDQATKIDEILQIVRNLRSLDSTVIEMRNRADEAEKLHEKAVKALLLGCDVIYSAVKFMNATDAGRDTPEMKSKRSDWAEKKTDFLLAARQVWAEHEDPYYDPNNET